ncbi:GNAT family N-acetyltransferase [Roseibium salinum]|uniref:GNAT family N-acetyltransferase n=2 Tax=Roseibium salinum TaxID=1604349 RepID=A0ABT3R200_9HYPH|nr:GNAT family N-acetyltransferase [Roseibium sp. DSM 29163]MCX2723116.1 GNAT family N-acetyltransferase [Roseibium sp. DSM 29163]
MSPQDLCAAMNTAFSDYLVPMHMSESRFSQFQRQRGFSARHSFVALKDGRVAAFWFSSPPDRRYGSRAYTLSVGTDPAHRRKGLSRGLLEAVLDVQRAEAASGLQLEVITTNAKAVSAYEKLEFQRHRTLRVYKLQKAALQEANSGRWSIGMLEIDELPADEGAYFDTEPTPQNSRSAMIALSPDVHLVGARHNGRLLGWAAAFEDGAVAQLAVHRDHRRRGLGKALLSELATRTRGEQLNFVNVDEAAEGLNAFLGGAGAEELLKQFEMRLVL